MMEPVPEAERMEKFRASSAPTLTLKDSSFHAHHGSQDSSENSSVPRHPIELSLPSPLSSSSPASPYTISPDISPRPRMQLLSRSSSGTLSPPPMSRTQSMPGLNSKTQLRAYPNPLPASPRIPMRRARSPRKPVDEVFIGIPNRTIGIYAEGNSLNEKEHLTPRVYDPNTSLSSATYPCPRIRQPMSPRYALPQENSPGIGASAIPPLTSPPATRSSRYSDSFLGANYCYSAPFSSPGSLSSFLMPSTPTSARSRSPSISSLETIPDSPDAEEAALEAERSAQRKAAADASEGNKKAESKNTPETTGVGRGRMPGIVYGRDKRKRWSVCGAERRGDLNLDTIWED